MTKFHLTYVESRAVPVGYLTLDMTDVDYLAVLCWQCRPMDSAVSTILAGEDSVTEQAKRTWATFPSSRSAG
jgi:hypothetical protein